MWECCRHSNTFFREAEGGGCEPDLVQLSLTYTQGGDEVGVIRRAVCAPPGGVLCVEIGRSCITVRRDGADWALCLGHRDIHTTMEVMRGLVSVDATACDVGEGVDSVRKRLPSAKNICGRASVHGCRVDPSLERSGVLGEEKSGIGKGKEINTVLCKAMSTFSGGTEFISIVASKNIAKSVQFLSKLCNINTRSPVCVYMAIFSATLPHRPSLGSNGGPLVFALNNWSLPANRLYNLNERDNCMVDINFERWDDLAGYLIRTMGEGGTAADRFTKYVGEMDKVSRGVVMGTKLKVKVSHKGNVSMSFSWSNHLNMGNLPWTVRNTRVVGEMMMMALQLVEMCS